MWRMMDGSCGQCGGNPARVNFSPGHSPAYLGPFLMRRGERWEQPTHTTIYIYIRERCSHMRFLISLVV